MTRDDCYKSLLNTKVFVKDRSASIQCILFSLGFEWNGGKSCSSLVRRTDAPFLFISEDGKITCSNSTNHFYSMNNKEVSAEYILSMKYVDEEITDTVVNSNNRRKALKVINSFESFIEDMKQEDLDILLSYIKNNYDL